MKKMKLSRSAQYNNTTKKARLNLEMQVYTNQQYFLQFLKQFLTEMFTLFLRNIPHNALFYNFPHSVQFYNYFAYNI